MGSEMEINLSFGDADAGENLTSRDCLTIAILWSTIGSVFGPQHQYLWTTVPKSLDQTFLIPQTYF
ncbi:unnamed protein product [Acidithrix sp. C25]|nr:unnamed protein product [Acidithrix sp. C25]